MKILALRPEGLVLPSIHASMMRAFQSLGVDILELRTPQIQEEYKSLRLLARGFQAVFTLDLGRDRTFISRLKDLQELIRIPWIIWFVDDPEGYGFPMVCAPHWTKAFCWDGKISSESISNGISLFHLPLAADPEIFSPEETGSAPLFPGGVFVGSASRANEILEEVARTTPGFSGDLEGLWKVYRRDFTRSPQDLAWLCLGEKTGQKLDLIRMEPLYCLWVHAAAHALGERKRREIVFQLIGPGGGVFGGEEWKKVVAAFYQGEITYGSELEKIYNQRVPLFWTSARPRPARALRSGSLMPPHAPGRFWLNSPPSLKLSSILETNCYVLILPNRPGR